jgi:putative Mg2+ transporter-C (MgtC) family protein
MDLSLNPTLTIAAQVELGLRLTVGLALGAIIGFERELHRQPAGFRTHSLVALGAALFAIISGYGYTGASADPTRIAAQIVSGIGFIGAGTILQHRGHIRGLTTAASLWSVAAIGTATGTGLYVLAGLGTVLILVVLSVLDRVEAFARRRFALGPDGYDIAERTAHPEPLPPDADTSEGHTEDMP